eukprot:g7202.t1
MTWTETDATVKLHAFTKYSMEAFVKRRKDEEPPGEADNEPGALAGHGTGTGSDDGASRLAAARRPSAPSGALVGVGAFWRVPLPPTGAGVAARGGIGLFFCRRCWHLREHAWPPPEPLRALPPGWAQFVDRATWASRFVHVGTGRVLDRRPGPKDEPGDEPGDGRGAGCVGAGEHAGHEVVSEQHGRAGDRPLLLEGGPAASIEESGATERATSGQGGSSGGEAAAAAAGTLLAAAMREEAQKAREQEREVATLAAAAAAEDEQPNTEPEEKVPELANWRQIVGREYETRYDLEAGRTYYVHKVTRRKTFFPTPTRSVAAPPP